MTDICNFEAEGFVLAKWPTQSLEKTFRDYVIEHAKPNGVSVKAVAGVAWHAFRVIDPTREASSITRADFRALYDLRIADGVQPATVRRESTYIIAPLRHARREERLDKDPPKFPKIPAPAPRLRYLTREEYARLMQTPMSRRMRMFFLIAFSVGARSEAIEQLTWDRVSLERRTMDFRLPGVNHKNKRRVVAPISDALLARLQTAYDRPDRDEYVIGAGESGRCTSTYHESKRVLAAAGIKEWGVARHVARHSVASWLLQADTPIDKVARLLGDTVSMVEKVYGHLKPEHLVTAN